MVSNHGVTLFQSAKLREKCKNGGGVYVDKKSSNLKRKSIEIFIVGFRRYFSTVPTSVFCSNILLSNEIVFI